MTGLSVQNVIAVVTLLLAVATTVAAMRRGRRTDVKADKDDLLTRVRRLEVKSRVLDDYCNELRTLLRDAGLKVPDWPSELTEGGV